MRKRILWLALAGVALSWAAQAQTLPGRLSVRQLEQVLRASKDKRDGELAKELSAVVLSERLSFAQVQQLGGGLPGEKSRQALLALADSSAFLKPPANRIPATAPPDFAAQKRMMGLTVNYIAKTLPLLPNLFATRSTMRFESDPTSQMEDAAENPLHTAGSSALTVFYRDGKEFLDAGANKKGSTALPDKGLTTWGEFGPILGTVLIDAARSKLAWSHWEMGAGGLHAVFRYEVPRETSHYEVRFCCVTRAYGLEVNYLKQRAGYHGEITIDPDSGTILRLTVIADLPDGNPIGQAALAVEYGPVELGGKTYFCPVRGIALAQSPDLNSLRHSLKQLELASLNGGDEPVARSNEGLLTEGPRQVLLNDISFHHYHLFGTTARIITDDEAKRETADASHGTPANEAGVPSMATAVASDTAGLPNNAREGTAGEMAAAVMAPATTAGVPALKTVAAPVLPEISVVTATGLPKEPEVNTPGNSDATVTFHMSTRLVDVSLVALDKKGHPVTNLKPEDFEIFDNGEKVDLHYFSQAGGQKEDGASVASAPAVAPAAQSFSNRSRGPVEAKAGDAGSNTIVLLIDNTLSFGDLGNVREQMGSFLKTLPSGERVGLYVMQRGGFMVLQEPTTNSGLVAYTLSKWTPSSDNIALGQEMEARNRQDIDTVRNTEDLLSVNGNDAIDPSSQIQALDPKLREMGDSPGRSALAVLPLVARRLAAIPGHKSLVWIASDNVLADWDNNTLNVDKGDRYIEPAALHVQEAMNDAHVTVYPLDASRLEGNAIDPSHDNWNVALSPTATANMVSSCGLVTQGSLAAQAAGNGPELTAGEDINTCQYDRRPGRAKAQMKADLHSIQGVYREIADATGGRAFRRSMNIVGELNDVAEAGRATYQLSFSPAKAADNKYHLITVKLAGRKNIQLRYRSGYFYRQEPTSIQDRFRNAVLKPNEATEIGLNASFVPGASGHTLKLDIAGTDLEMAQKDGVWTDKVDVFVAQGNAAKDKAQVTGQTMILRLTPESYQKYLREGVPFHQELEAAPGTTSMRIIVVDENSGRIGSLTIPLDAVKDAS